MYTFSRSLSVTNSSSKKLPFTCLLSRSLPAAYRTAWRFLNPFSVSWAFPPGLVSWSHPENLQGKGSPRTSLDVKSGSAQYEKRWSSQITYCCSQCSRRGHAPVKPKEQCPEIAKDATLMSQSCRLSGPHLHRLHPVHNKTHKKERQQGVPLWESTAHTEPAWFNAKIVNRALVPNALNAE